MTYVVDNKISNEFKDLIRVVRNFIERIRSLQKQHLHYTATPNYKDLHRLLQLFTENINKNIYQELTNNTNKWHDKEFKQEIKKANLIVKNIQFKEIIFQLEDYIYLKGDITNFLNDEINKMELYVIYIREIFDNTNDDLIIRAMISVGDCRFSKGGTARINARYFFWKKQFMGNIFNKF
ncbi:MAG: hypothetical protein Q9M39_02930 [Sulfurovum sp.]|nr:hypothetical protein [Sulfurovum sp.]